MFKAIVYPPLALFARSCVPMFFFLLSGAWCGAASAQPPAINTECSTLHAASKVLADLAQAYEANDLLLIRKQLDPALIGYQRFIDGVSEDFNREKQLRLHLKDLQMQCGPDVTVINVTWEKRFLDLNTFQPGLLTGRMSILLHRNRDQWQLAAVAGDSPFGTAASGTLAELTVAPSVDISSLSVVVSGPAAASNPTPVNLPFALSVVDADQAGRGGLQVVVTTSHGDRETVTLAETMPGHFTRASMPFSASATAAAVVPGDGMVQVFAGTTLTVRYADLNPGNNRPATVLTRTVPTIGSPTAVVKTPNLFSFAAVTNVAPGTLVTSNAIAVSGINTAVPIGITGGTYSVNGGAFTSTPGMVNNGATAQVRITASAGPTTTKTATLNIGGVSGTFSVTTAAADTTPDPFFFAGVSNVAPSTPTTSMAIIVSGVNAPTAISVSGGSYAINGGAFTTAPGTVSNGQSVALRVTSSANTGGSGTAMALLNIGGVTGGFTVTTYDTQPNPFGWMNSLACPAGTIDSMPVMISGLTGPASISVASGSGIPAAAAQYSINGGLFTAAPGTVTNGQTVTLRVTRYGTLNPLTVRAIINIGGVTGTWSTSC